MKLVQDYKGTPEWELKSSMYGKPATPQPEADRMPDCKFVTVFDLVASERTTRDNSDS